jgi:hypothetical protein
MEFFMNASDFFTSNLLNATSIPADVRIEATVVSARPREFDDGLKLIIYTDYRGKGVVLNQTRLGALVEAWGLNYEDWAGKQIIISQGSTTYGGKAVPCVKIEPVVAERIARQGAPVAAIGNRRGPP